VAVEMSARVDQYFNAYMMNQSELLDIADEALRLTAGDWLEFMLPQKFESQAHMWYGLRLRSKKWNEAKRRGRIPAGGFARSQMRKQGLRVATWIDITPQPVPLPFVATGELKRETYGRRAELLSNAKVENKSAGAGEIRLVMKIPFPHPVLEMDGGMISLIDDRDMTRLKQRFHVHLREIIARRGFQRRPGAAVGRGGYPVAA